MKRIEIIGAGYIGLPLAASFSCKHEVMVVEADQKKLVGLQEGTFHYEEKDVDALLQKNRERIRFLSSPEESDVFILAVQTPVNEIGDPDLSFLRKAIRNCAPFLKDDTLLILESTVSPGACRDIETLLASLSINCGFAYCPETILPGRVMEELKNNPRVIGGSPEDTRRAKEVYEEICSARIDLVSFEEAELVKLVENAKRDVDLAFANQIAEIAEKSGVDPFDLIEKVNAHPRVHVLNPGSGVGGHCIAVDPLFLIKKFGWDASLLSSAREVNDRKPLLVAQKAAELCQKDEPIVVFGLSYKKDVDDLRNASGIGVAHALKAMGYEAYGCEPNSKETVIEGIKNLSIEEALAMGKAFVIAQPHTAFLPYVKALKEKKVIDAVGLLR